MPKPEFELINDVFMALVDREEQSGEDSITDIERVVLLIWHASGIIGNGGFRYFFECGLPLRLTADAYARIGLDEVAGILHRVLELFPRHEIPDDYDERMEIVEGFFQKNSEFLEKLVQEFYDADGLMERQLAGWIRVHKDVFMAESDD